MNVIFIRQEPALHMQYGGCLAKRNPGTKVSGLTFAHKQSQKNFPGILRSGSASESEEKKMGNGLLQSIADNVIFVLVCVGVAAALFLIACGTEKAVQKKNGVTERILTTRKITMIGLFSALAVILHMLDFPVPFAPGFYQLDFSEIPTLVGAFAFGPVAGVMIEFCKILLKLVIKGTSTAFVGDLANFVIGCSLVLPASILYMFKKTKKRAIAACVAGSVIMTVFGSAFNGVYLLPAFSKLFGMPLEAIIAAGAEINGNIHNITSFVIFAVAPMNIVKSVAASGVTMLIYKPLSPILKNANPVVERRAGGVSESGNA